MMQMPYNILKQLDKIVFPPIRIVLGRLFAVVCNQMVANDTDIGADGVGRPNGAAGRNQSGALP
jgi:hypothetical protein